MGSEGNHTDRSRPLRSIAGTPDFDSRSKEQTWSSSSLTHVLADFLEQCEECQLELSDEFDFHLADDTSAGSTYRVCMHDLTAGF